MRGGGVRLDDMSTLSQERETLALRMIGDEGNFHDLPALGATARTLTQMGIPSRILMCSATLNPNSQDASDLSFMTALEVDGVILAGAGRYGWREIVNNDLSAQGLPLDHEFHLLEKPTPLPLMMLASLLDEEGKEEMRTRLAHCAGVREQFNASLRASPSMAA